MAFARHARRTRKVSIEVGFGLSSASRNVEYPAVAAFEGPTDATKLVFNSLTSRL